MAVTNWDTYREKKRDRRAVQGKNGQEPLASGEKDTFFFYSRCHIEERREKKLCLTARCILNTRACYSVTITENKKTILRFGSEHTRDKKSTEKWRTILSLLFVRGFFVTFITLQIE